MDATRRAGLVFPHQLFLPHPLLGADVGRVVLIEDTLFFGDARYPMRVHRQRLAYHRATITAFLDKIDGEGPSVRHERYRSDESDLRRIARELADAGVDTLVVCDVHDFMLRKRLERAAEKCALALEWLDTPMFINTPGENRDYRAERSRWFMADFYAWQRKRLDILMNGEEPVGGRWSFDEENRKKLPAQLKPELPELPAVRQVASVREALGSVAEDFPDNPGSAEHLYYPDTHAGAERFLDAFLEERFARFGPYEDAMAHGERWLYHGVLTPMLNVGLLTPERIVRRALEAADALDVPLASTEGFLRQIIGWREFMRATYDDLGVKMRTTNRWGHERELPEGFYTAETGIAPIDDALSRLLETGYCHHIERLMLLGGFLFLAETHPDRVYRWFMEMFVDAYDWVMVPNAYAMSQNADGGHITTKPYFSGSNYILKMSDHPKGEWCALWDALFWRWIIRHADELGGNPRWSMMVRNAERMDRKTREGHLDRAARWLDG